MAEGGEEKLDIIYLRVNDDESSPSEEEFSEAQSSATQQDEGEEFRQQQGAYKGQSSEQIVTALGSEPVEEEEEIIYNMQKIEKMCKETFNTGGVDGLNKLLKTNLSQWKKVPVNIAVVGFSGSGKSSFINAMRDMEKSDIGAAAVGHTETTFNISRYVHPQQKNISFWDLPGIGTSSFPQKLYEKKINNILKELASGVQNISEFDFFIILTADRFTEHDQWLAESISKRYQKKFYFVRTRVDINIYIEKHTSQGGPQNSDDEIKQKLRKYCQANLQSVNCSDTRIFLIDNYDKKAHDFDKLRQCLFEDAPESKREALAFTLSGFSEDMIEAKRSLFLDRLYISSLKCISSRIWTRPLANEIRFIKEQFGVAEEQLSEYARIPDIFPLKSQYINTADEFVKDNYSLTDVSGGTAVFGLAVIKKLWIVALGAVVIREWWKLYQFLKMIINTCADDAKKIQKAILKVHDTSSTV